MESWRCTCGAARRSKSCEQGPDALDARRLDREVELAAQGLGEVGEDRGQVDDATEGRPVAGLLGEQLEQGEILEDLPLGTRALHLEHDGRAVGQRGAVHLGDRSGGQRGRLDLSERVLPGDAELGLEHRHDLGLRERRHVVLQPRELGDVLGRQQVGARREHLAELGERRAELLECLAQPACTVCGRTVVAQPVPCEDAADLGRASEQALARLLGPGRPGAVGHEDDAATGGV